MDVRLSPEQVALRDSAAQVVDRLGPHAVGELDDPERAGKLDAAVAASGWRELRSATDDGSPWASGVEVALVAEELGRGLADAPFLGPTLAAELRRLAGAPPAALARDRGAGARPVGGRLPPGGHPGRRLRGRRRTGRDVGPDAGAGAGRPHPRRRWRCPTAPAGST